MLFSVIIDVVYSGVSTRVAIDKTYIIHQLYFSEQYVGAVFYPELFMASLARHYVFLHREETRG